MALKLSKMKTFKTIFLQMSLLFIMTLNAKNFVCRSNGVTCGQYKDKEGKTLKKTFKGPKNVKNLKFRKNKKAFSHSYKANICNELGF